MMTFTPPACWELGRGTLAIVLFDVVDPLPHAPEVELDEVDDEDDVLAGTLIKLAMLIDWNCEQGKSVFSESGLGNSPQFGATVPDAGKKLVESNGIRTPKPMSLTVVLDHNPALRFSVTINVVVVPSPVTT